MAKRKKKAETKESYSVVDGIVDFGIVFCPKCNAIVNGSIVDYGLDKNGDYYFVSVCCGKGVRHSADSNLKPINNQHSPKPEKTVHEKKVFKSKGNIFDDFDGFDL